MAEQYFGGKGRRRKSKYELLEEQRKMLRSFKKADTIGEMSKLEAQEAKEDAERYLEKELQDDETSSQDEDTLSDDKVSKNTSD